MGIAKPLINDFTGGEVDPAIEGKVNAPSYHKTCRLLENLIPLVSGGAERRPGSYNVPGGQHDNTKCRLIDFPTATVYGHFILELTDIVIRVYSGLTHAYVFEMVAASPYLEAQLFQVKYVQYENTMYLVHPAHAPRKIVFGATAANDWTLSAPAFTTPPWSDATDYPSCICFYEQRLIVARGLNLWASATAQAGGYEDFTVADRIGHEFPTKYEILWLVNTDEINIGTDGAEWVFSGGDRGGIPLAQNTALIRRKTTNGDANVQAILANDVVIYVQKGAKRVREFVYSEERKGYLSPDLTYLASHIAGEGTIVGMTFQQSPDSIIWAWTSTGALISLTYQKMYSVMAWARHPIDGVVESVAVIPGTTEDEIWISVKRNIDGTDKWFIEYFKPRGFGSDQKDCFFVDCGLTWEGEIAQNITLATVADPVVITIVGHTFSNDEIVKIEHVAGLTELNNQYYMVKSAGADTFELYLEDGTDGVDGTQFSLNYDNLDGAFEVGETITEEISGNTGLVVSDNGTTLVINTVVGSMFTDNREIEGGTSGATANVNGTKYTAFIASIVGDVTNDTYWITGVSAADIAEITVGMWATGTGIPTGAVITEIDVPNLTFKISKEANKTGADVTISIGGTSIQVSKTIAVAHLEGEVVAVLADGAAHPDCTVDTAAITLQRYANTVHVGLPYISKLKSQRLNPPTAKKRIHEMLIRFKKTLGCKVGPDEDHLDAWDFRKSSDPMDTPPSLLTGDISRPYSGPCSRDGDILIVQDQPLPLTVLAIMPEVGIYG